MLFWINRCCLFALSDEEFFGQFILDVDIRFMVDGVQQEMITKADRGPYAALGWHRSI